MEGDEFPIYYDIEEKISIHSLRMEGDKKGGTVIGWIDISIHSLRMEGDVLCLVQFVKYSLFQSTPSAWRETHTPPKLRQSPHISIHSLRMEGDNDGRSRSDKRNISIHSLRMEGDILRRASFVS